MRKTSMKWISVKEKLPDFGAEVFLAVPRENTKPDEPKFWYQIGYLESVTTTKTNDGIVSVPEFNVHDSLGDPAYWTKIEDPS